MDSMASARREITMSAQRPPSAASRPSGTPITAAPSTATTPAARLARAPNSTRDSTSRPFSSVPKGCVAEGGWRSRDHEVSSGSKGAIQGASSAASTKASTTTSPNIASRCRQKRRAARRAGLSPKAALMLPS
jgi:hypothetical protein